MRLGTKNLARHPKLPTRWNWPNCVTFHRGLILMVTVLLLSGTVAAQDTRKTREDAAARLMAEGLQLATEGSPESLTKAVDKFEAAREILQSLNFPAGEGAVVAALGGVYNLLEQNETAIEKYEQSLPLFRAANQPKGEATALLHLGLIHSKSGDMEKGMDYLGRALTLFREANEPQGEVIALSSMATLQIFLGKPEETIGYYNQVLEISRATASRESEVGALP